MKTLKQVEHEGRVPIKLVRAVIRQLGGGKGAIENLSDVYQHGADGGFCGFIYYTDTVKFYRRNRSDIVAMAEEMSGDLGVDVIDMIRHFGCFRGRDVETSCIARALYGNVDDKEVPNALAWFALEEVARAFYD